MNLQNLTDDQLAGLFSEGTEADRDAVLAEADRRDRAAAKHAKAAARWAAVYAEWHEFAHAQYLAAEAATNGYLLSRAGLKDGIDPWTLWSGSAARAAKYMSEELRDFWLKNKRMTVEAYYRQGCRERRIARVALAA